MLYPACDIARYIVNYSNKKEYLCSNLKLQKLMYFVQAYSLITTKRPIFEETIEAWDFGPVVPAVYHEFKRFGAGNIPFIKRYYVGYQEYAYDPGLINKKSRRLIESVVDHFKDYSSTDLVELTHSQAPWTDNYKPDCQNVIPLSSIQAYFATE